MYCYKLIKANQCFPNFTARIEVQQNGEIKYFHGVIIDMNLYSYMSTPKNNLGPYVFNSDHSYLYKTKGKYNLKQINNNRKVYIHIINVILCQLLIVDYLKYFGLNIILEMGWMFSSRHGSHLFHRAEDLFVVFEMNPSCHLIVKLGYLSLNELRE